ncbi:MAG: VWA domain-containing protein, partial [Verrucomicrobiota bacterium]
YYSKNWDDTGINWLPYTAPFSVATGEKILVYTKSVNASFDDSYTGGGLFVRNDYVLQTPSISSSASYLDLETPSAVTVSVSDPNPSNVPHTLKYQINGGGWITYSGGISVQPTQYQTGFQIVAKSFPAASGVLESPEGTAQLPVKLMKPIISVAELQKGDTKMDVSIANPNPSGSSEILYSVKNLKTGSETAFTSYSGDFDLKSSDYPDGVQITAYASPSSSVYLKSDNAQSDEKNFFGVELQDATVYVLDVSGSMQWNNGLKKVQEEMNRVLDAMDSDDKFAIIKFASSASNVRSWQSATSNNVKNSKKAVDKLKASGSTNYEAALKKALNLVKKNDVKQVFFLSDGAPTKGSRSTSSLLSQVDKITAAGARLDTLAFGSISNSGRVLLEKMDERGDVTVQ